MSEITKLYENAGINKIGIKRCSGIRQSICLHNCNGCESFDYKYPPFTAEKQFELIKLLKDNRDFHACGNWCTSLDSTGETIEHRDGKFEEALAGLINQLFTAQDLTEEEKQQVKGILEVE